MLRIMCRPPALGTRRQVLSALGAGSIAAVLSACQKQGDLLAGESGRVARISDGDLIYLDTGQAVRLVEIEAPGMERGGRPADAHGEESRRLLASAAQGRIARLYYGGLSRDRYDRALAHVIVQDEIGRDVWLNGLMVRQGGARVRTFPDNARRARTLLDLEAAARDERRGLWALADYGLLAPADVLGPRPFAIVEGVLEALSDATGDSLVKIRPQGFELRLGPRLRDIDSGLPLTLGTRLRLRGRIDVRPLTGPALQLTHWEQVELVETRNPNEKGRS